MELQTAERDPFTWGLGSLLETLMLWALHTDDHLHGHTPAVGVQI